MSTRGVTIGLNDRQIHFQMTPDMQSDLTFLILQECMCINDLYDLSVVELCNDDNDGYPDLTFQEGIELGAKAREMNSKLISCEIRTPRASPISFYFMIKDNETEKDLIPKMIPKFAKHFNKDKAAGLLTSPSELVRQVGQYVMSDTLLTKVVNKILGE